jgi:hypothetical protein
VTRAGTGFASVNINLSGFTLNVNFQPPVQVKRMVG